MSNGVCKLTGATGKFINSHIIPAALTRPEVKGEPFVTAGNGNRPRRQFSSWTDRELVTQEGEDVLTALDTWAIDVLRKSKMVWSGWGAVSALPSHKTERSSYELIVPETGWGIRSVKGIDFPRLRLFFLSLLWRAAASDRPEFADVSLPVEHINALRRMIIDGNPTPYCFYPITLSQLSTRGDAHNFTPIKSSWDVNGGGASDRTQHVFRFYFDGLIVFFHIGEFTEEQLEKWYGKMAVAFSDELVCTAVTYERSFQLENLKMIMLETAQRWPADYVKLMSSVGGINRNETAIAPEHAATPNGKLSHQTSEVRGGERSVAKRTGISTMVRDVWKGLT
ncbi:transposase [Burkholderia cenocepacia]|uniref:hypothetical protein n=1 Tax=Burkholderia cepacia complex TaxID=87882 RepID=UPI00192B68C6|nr:MULTISPECIES: hypothetical protein [Burkholderia cepacia complex]CAD9219248.1 transposase [Burkholderia cenocepacia]CAG9263814.1 transposase [Burkholderia cepacia]